MDHEVVPRSCKICDWLLNSSWNHFGLGSRVTMKFEVPKRHVLRPTSSTYMIQRVLWWERQKKCSSRKRQKPMAKKHGHNKIQWNLYGEREDEDKGRRENGQTWKNLSFQNYAFQTYISKKITTFVFQCMVHIQFTPNEGPKNFISWYFFRKLNHRERPSSMVQLTWTMV